MFDDADPVAADSSGRHERPFLYSWNLRLRHLQGISIRNLHVTTAKAAGADKTTVDDDFGLLNKSPTKRLLQSESRTLHHARSSSDLSSTIKLAPSLPRTSSTTYEKANKDGNKSRPPKLRRRSTLHWSGASPSARQEKLEDVAESRVADSWFSLHSDDGTEDPFYISEVMEKSMNPSFRFFDLATTGSSLTRSDQLKLRLWARTVKMEEYVQLVDLDANLRSLQFIGKTLENFHHPLPVNCILFHMSDGIYTSFTDLPAGLDQAVTIGDTKQQSHREPTSSFDALMQLANLDDCIQDALNARHSLENQVNALLGRREGMDQRSRRSTVAKEGLRHTQHALGAETRYMQQLQRKIDDMRGSIQARREKVSRGQDLRKATKRICDRLQEDSTNVVNQNASVEEAAMGQRRRISEDLQVVFPIEPIRNKTLQFSIRGVYLPNSAFDDTNRDEIAAALGLTAGLIHMLSLYLSAPLPYLIDMGRSEPAIEDRISVALTQRRFPLQPTNVAYKFEYGVFLLNKDVEFLMAKAGLRTIDIRHTLPNLKYLLYVLSAGKGELPARKAGGVRGLLGAKPPPASSRRSSQDSVNSSSAYMPQPQHQEKAPNGSVRLSSSPRENGLVKMKDPFLVSS